LHAIIQAISFEPYSNDTFMSSQIDYTTQELRRRILSGQVAPGERMVELELSAQLAVSRTPIRIALGELEKEGLLERLPTRGFRVRQFSVDEITNAVDVRGVLEGMAARQAAERGITPKPGPSCRPVLMKAACCWKKPKPPAT
jgi:GntR family transcriptional regulator of vanillate catabolism